MKRNVLVRRAASAALAACMMFSLSAPALAASTDALLQQSTAAKSAVSVLDEENGTEAEPAYEMNLKYGSITVYIGEDGKQYAKQGNNDPQKRGNLQITTDGGRTNNTLTIEGGTTGAKVTLSNVNIVAPGAAVSVSGNVELVITGTNTLRSGTDRAGLEKADDNGTLTIDGTGTLNAYGGDCAAGIGSSFKNNVCNIVINGGTITAECTGMLGAGIGGGKAGKAENIRINGGVVTATGGEWGFGIGSGYYTDTSWLPTTITITGGTVKAIAGMQGAAIGALVSANDLTMTGGSLTVQKSNDSRAWIISTTGSEMNRGSLTGAVTYQDGSGSVVVQDYGIAVGRENTPPTRVTSKNYNDIFEDGALCYDIEEKTLKLKDGNFFDGNLTITAPEDVSIDLEANASHVVKGDLTVNGAKDVKVTKPESSDAAAAIEGKAEISCSGDVILKNLGGDIGSGRNLTKYGLTVHRANNVTTEGGISGEANINCTGNIVLGNEWGTTASKLTVNSAYNVTVTSGSSYRSIGEGVDITCSGTVKISGKRPIEGDVKIVAGQDVSLEYKKDGDNQNVINITAAGKVELNRNGAKNLGRVIFTQANDKPYVYFTDKSSEEFKDSRITPIPGTIESRYLRIEPRETYNITVKNGTVQVGDDTTGLTSAFEGETVTVRANKLPDEVAAGTEFYGWEVARDSAAFTLTEGKLGSKEEAGTEKISFEMPKGNVKLTACWSASSLDPEHPIDPDEPLDPDFGHDARSAAGGTIAAVAVGGAAIWGGYEMATRVILHNFLPEGAAIPANRGQLALLVWNTAGRPEPAGAPAFADVADPDMAKAAQWCTEQGTMDAKGDCFEPEGWIPKFKVIEVWNKAFPKQ